MPKEEKWGKINQLSYKILWRMIPMAMISASDFRNGVTFEMEGKVMQVVW